MEFDGQFMSDFSCQIQPNSFHAHQHYLLKSSKWVLELHKLSNLMGVSDMKSLPCLQLIFLICLSVLCLLLYATIQFPTVHTHYLRCMIAVQDRSQSEENIFEAYFDTFLWVLSHLIPACLCSVYHRVVCHTH